MRRRFSPALRLALTVGVSGFFLWLAFRGQSWPEVAVSLAAADYRALLPALVLYFLGVWVRALRWRVLLSPVARLDAAELFPVVVVGYMANDVLPARLGELVRVHLLAERHRVSRPAALGTIIIERLLDAVTMLLLLLVGAVALSVGGPVLRVGLLTAGLLGLAGLGILLVRLRPSRAAAALRWLLRRAPAPLRMPLGTVAREFWYGMSESLRGSVVLPALLLSLVAWLLEGGMYIMVAGAFGLGLGVPAALLTLAVANLATLVPSAPGYLGTFEAGALLVLRGVVGLPMSEAAAYALVLHMALVVPVSLLGAVYWLRYQLSTARIRSHSTAARAARPGMEADAVD